MDSKSPWLLAVVITTLVVLAIGVYVFAARARAQERLAMSHARTAELQAVIAIQQEELQSQRGGGRD